MFPFLRLLRVSDGSLELMDCSSILPGFNYAPGFQNWNVYDGNFNFVPSFNEVLSNMNAQIQKGMFSDEEFNRQHNLNRCMRLLPHHNDDGGFFVALLKKNKPLPWENSGKGTDRN